MVAKIKLHTSPNFAFIAIFLNRMVGARAQFSYILSCTLNSKCCGNELNDAYQLLKKL